MVAGLHDIDWARMRHAYGPADAVPDAIRGMVAKKKRRRAWAWDYMFGAVHHQGDVYECTVAAIPFLVEAAMRPGRRGRVSVLKLLASIGSADIDDLRALDDAPGGSHDAAVDRSLYRRAHAMVDAAGPTLISLLDDPRRKVRRAVPSALLASRAHAGEVLAALQHRLSVEPDGRVRAAVMGAVAAIGRRAEAGLQPGVDAAAVRRELRASAERATDPTDQLAALIELARGPAGDDAGMAAPTMAALALAGAAGGDARTMSVAFGDRVSERTDLVVALLCHRDPATRANAMWATGALVGRWRGPYEEMLYLVGEQLSDPRRQLRALAADRLANLGSLAAPAAEALARAAGSWPEEDDGLFGDKPPGLFTVQPDGSATLGNLLEAMVGLRDPRALPILLRATTREQPVKYLASYVSRYGASAADLVPWARRQLAAADPDRTDELVHLLGAIGVAAADAVPDLLACLPRIEAIEALGRIGSAAAVAPLHRLSATAEAYTAVAAAEALRRITGDLAVVLAVLELVGDPEVIAGTVAEIGPAAATYAPRMRTLMLAPDTDAWTRSRAARALWRVTGDADEVLPTLADIWQAHRRVRGRVADLVAEIGPVAAPVFGPLLRTELATARRATADTNGWSSAQVVDDLEILASARTALAALDTDPPMPPESLVRSPEALAGLLRDERLPVRREAPAALMACGAQARDLLTALRNRLPVEPDARTRQAIREAMDTIGRRAAAGFLPDVDAAAVAL
ncbi:hypothetical protein AB0368_08965 [Actinoplanes sp. NPDC051475]|uniref:hypothetical protein n=1 Tax=Actinoplanes sp. NPDC051475 TaxID=3157225 RepID=UPI00344ECCF5